MIYSCAAQLLQAQSVEHAHAVPAQKSAAERVAGLALALENQRAMSRPGEGDRRGGTRRPTTEDYRIFSTHSRNGKAR
jgi:hypothetical protein